MPLGVALDTNVIGAHEIQRLVAVVEPVEFSDRRPDIVAIVAERRFLPGLGIAFLEEVFPHV